MEHPRAIRVTVYLDVGCEPMSGTVAISDEEERRFQGWIEFARAIDRALAIGPADDQEAPDGRG